MRQIPLLPLLAAAFGVLTSALAAHADEAAKVDQFARRMFATALPVAKAPGANPHACFVRTYDAAHLARHRGQTVTAVKMLVRAEKLPEDGGLSYSYELRINFRDRPGEYAASFTCGNARSSDLPREGVRIYCHDGCEGGGVEIALAPSNKAIIVKIEDVSLQPADKPDDPDAALEFRGSAEDRTFRLDRVDSENCDSLIAQRDEVAAAPSK